MAGFQVAGIWSAWGKNVAYSVKGMSSSVLFHFGAAHSGEHEGLSAELPWTELDISTLKCHIVLHKSIANSCLLLLKKKGRCLLHRTMMLIRPVSSFAYMRDHTWHYDKAWRVLTRLIHGCVHWQALCHCLLWHVNGLWKSRATLVAEGGAEQGGQWIVPTDTDILWNALGRALLAASWQAPTGAIV